MKVKTLYGWTESKMDDRINHFINDPRIEVIHIQYASPVFFFSAMVTYKEKKEML
ncbi:hypothetical protein ACQCT6_19760 [Cytobacillus gottheilii]|uniref:Uncharacterized protein n=1 Tax=Cytobacillus gottheilii TaxID=859144 RepID=A0ABX8F6T6_9BACI|nr:hypothetical protein [Cytobacillus gottheilii]QVY60059.1 hypothetical protein J1899_13530 [Cytobacillus gottheilii]